MPVTRRQETREHRLLPPMGYSALGTEREDKLLHSRHVLSIYTGPVGGQMLQLCPGGAEPSGIWEEGTQHQGCSGWTL